MTIDTKYDIGETVWFMHKNKCVSMKIENINIEVKIKYIQYVFNESEIWISEKHLFSTREELLKSL